MLDGVVVVDVEWVCVLRLKGFDWLLLVDYDMIVWFV